MSSVPRSAFPVPASSPVTDRRPGSSALTGCPRRRQLWRVVDGAVAEVFRAHPDYLTRRGSKMARTAFVKRIVGELMGYEAGAAKAQPADTSPE